MKKLLSIAALMVITILPSTVRPTPAAASMWNEQEDGRLSPGVQKILFLNRTNTAILMTVYGDGSRGQRIDQACVPGASAKSLGGEYGKTHLTKVWVRLEVKKDKNSCSGANTQDSNVGPENHTRMYVDFDPSLHKVYLRI